ncbi:MAG: sulfatase [Verrucomicrobiota bacterium]|nr:sulfatase [Verrucomicrobiota bacterium]
MRLLKYLFITFFCFAVSAKPKNVLFIAVDDLKPLLNCYGYEAAVTPNIDELAKNGTGFLNAHCQQAVCGPSRVSLLTGYYPDCIGIYGMGGGKYKLRELHPEILTLPQHFKNNGYVTVGTGKIFDPRNVEDDWHGPQDAISWTEFFGKNSYNKETGAPKAGHYHNPEVIELAKIVETEGKAKGLKGKSLRNYMRDHGAGPAVECYDVPDDAYKDGGITKRGVQQIERFKDIEEPFFLAVGFLKPHLPFVAPKKYWDLYDRNSLPLATYQRAPHGAPDCSISDYVEARTYGGVPANGVITNEIQRELIHGYLACVSYVDAQIGELIAKLHKTGQYDNTIIVLWGDHGFHLGDKHLFGKHTNYEEATRSPLIIANHGLESGSMSYAPVNLIDLFPTLCELTGLATPDGLDGVSLVPVLEDASADVQEYAASLYPIDGYMGIAIRTQSYRYVAWYKGWPESGWCGKRYKSVPEFIELYDYTIYPFETKNLSGQEEYEEIEARLARLSREHVAYTQGKQFRN